jgi:hypothetical protein
MSRIRIRIGRRGLDCMPYHSRRAFSGELTVLSAPSIHFDKATNNYLENYYCLALKLGDTFLREITEKGIVLYEFADS